MLRRLCCRTRKRDYTGVRVGNCPTDTRKAMAFLYKVRFFALGFSHEDVDQESNEMI
jgi:hypothetical protein